ncbi:unnamed protein product [Phytophthora lilii]|uniref:Elongator complex protein 2 n=1 Tax=Phytophthora lilii TaxID=2077276 RepID=A0A9W6TSM9_9STRA|nr:unnamed protein product [Phytophthora lilii]
MAEVKATLEHVAVGCNAATNALSVALGGSTAASGGGDYCGAFVARNVVCLLRCSPANGEEASDSAPLAIATTLKHREATIESSRLTSVRLATGLQLDDARVLAGDSDGRVFLWSRADGVWKLQKLTEEQHRLPQVAVAAVATVETTRRRLYFAAFSDGTSTLFGEGEKQEVTLLSRLELGVKSIMETVDATVVSSRDGEEESVLLAAGGVDGKVHLFEVASGDAEMTKLLELEGHRGWIRNVAFQQQEQEGAIMLASASQDKRIRLWKITTRLKDSYDDNASSTSLEVKDGFLAHGRQTTYTVSFDALLLGHEDWVTSVQWTKLPGMDDGEVCSDFALLSSSMDNTLIVWTKSTDSRSSWSPSLRVGEMGGNGLLSAGVLPSRDGRLNLMSLSFGGQLERWEQEPAPSKRFLPAISVNGHCAEVTDLSWSPRGDYLMSVSLDQTSRVLAPSQRQESSRWFEISRAQVHGYDINCGCFVSGERPNDQFVSGADEKILRVFEAPDEVRHLVEHLKRAERDDESTQVSTGSQNRAVQHAYLPELSLTNKATTNKAFVSETESGHSNNGYASLDSSISLPVGDTLGRKTLWPEVRKLYGHGNELLCVISSHAGDLIVSACKSREERYAAVRLWNTADWSEVQQPLEGHKSSVVQLAFSPNDQLLLSVSRDRQFCLYERQLNSEGKFTLVESAKAHRRIIWSCSWSPDSRLFVLGSRDQSFSVWKEKGGKWAHACAPVVADAAVTAIAFAPFEIASSRSFLLAVGLETGAIRFFSLAKSSDTLKLSDLGEIAWELTPSAAVLRLAWAPASHRGYVLGAASSDSSVRLYSMCVKSHLGNLDTYSDCVTQEK